MSNKSEKPVFDGNAETHRSEGSESSKKGRALLIFTIVGQALGVTLMVAFGFILIMHVLLSVHDNAWDRMEQRHIESLEEHPSRAASSIENYIQRFEAKTGHEVLDAKVIAGDDEQDIVVMETSLGEKREAVTKGIELEFSEDVFGEWTVEGEWKDEAAKKAYVDAKTGN